MRFQKKYLLILTLCILSAACGGKLKIRPSESDYSPWDQIGGGKYRSNARSIDSPDRINFAYKISTGSIVGRSVIGAEGMLICGTLKGYLFSFDISNGKRTGKLRIKRELISAPVYDEGFIFFAAAENDNTLFGYDLERRKYLWKKKLGIIESSLTVSGNLLFAANRFGTVFCLDKLSGNILWTYRADSEIIADLIAVGSRLFAGTLKGKIAALDIKSGDLLWSKNTGYILRAGPSSDGRTLFWGSLNEKMIAVDVKTGNQNWAFKTEGPLFSTPSLSNNHLFFGCNDGNVYAVDKITGRLKWKYPAGTVVNTSCIILGDRVVFGTLGKKIIILDKFSGEKLSETFVEGKIISNPIYYAGKLVFPVENRYLYVFNVKEDE